MTADAPQPGTSALYTNKWTRPSKCGCGKVPYRNETAALAAADRQGEMFDVPFRAYKCPGTTRWHLSTRGFSPGALKSRPRILAWHLTARQVITQDALLRECGLDPMGWVSRPADKARKALRIFEQLGLVTFGDPRPGYIRAVDYEGLRRVMMVGLEEYAASRGMTVRRRPDPLGGSDDFVNQSSPHARPDLEPASPSGAVAGTYRPVDHTPQEVLMTSGAWAHCEVMGLAKDIRGRWRIRLLWYGVDAQGHRSQMEDWWLHDKTAFREPQD